MPETEQNKEHTLALAEEVVRAHKLLATAQAEEVRAEDAFRKASGEVSAALRDATQARQALIKWLS